MEKKMKKVCFIFAIFAAMFLMLACGKDSLLESGVPEDENNTSDTETTDQADTNDIADSEANDPAADTDDPNSQDDPNNQNDPNDPNNQNDPNDPNNQNDPNDPNNQNDPNDPNNQNDPTNPTDPTVDPTDPNNQNDPTNPTDPTVDPTDPTNDPTQPVSDPCNPNKCLEDEHSDGVCTVEVEEDSYSCGCKNDILGNEYMWYEDQCHMVVTPDQCRMFAETVASIIGGVPDWVTDVVEWVCHCFTESECVITWEW